MYFVIFTTDKLNSAHLRTDTRAAHLEYAARFGEQIVAGGATLTDDGQVMTGSFLLVEMADRAAVEEFVRNDPYVKAGLFETVEIRRWLKVVFNPPHA